MILKMIQRKIKVKNRFNISDSLGFKFMNVSGSYMDFLVVVLVGNMVNKKIQYNPAWRING